MKLLCSVAGWVRITLTCAAIAIAVFVALDDVSSYSRCKGKAFGTADFYLMGNPSPAKVLDCQELHWGGSPRWVCTFEDAAQGGVIELRGFQCPEPGR